MIEGMIKTSKYEIIAIFREELRKNSEVEVFFNNKRVITQLARVDFAEFHIKTNDKFPMPHKFKFILHSDIGKIEFLSTVSKNYAISQETEHKVSFVIPECIQVVQRRRDPRLRLPGGHHFSCHGRHKSGENYAFEIKDISDGGCALIAKNPNLKFLDPGTTLKNAILSLAEYGEVVVDLTIKNVTLITTADDPECTDSDYHISCQFKFRHIDNRQRVEKILLDLIMEAKRKKRVL